MMDALLTKPQPTQEDGVLLLTEPDRTFESAYLAAREAENRIVDNELLAQLPATPNNHPHHREWKMRQKSSDRTMRLVSWNGPVPDLGCGNGWFTNLMAQQSEHPVIGLDVNLPELKQAAAVFQRPNLSFAYGNVMADIFKPGSLHIIAINSCLQYFEDAVGTLNYLKTLLHPEGRIFIIDSPFYDADKVEGARQRSEEYYQKLGFPEMSAHYFHHPKSVLEPFRAEVVYDPNSIRNRARRLRGNIDSPFPMIRILA